MKILVTGGAGFIGSHIVKALDAKGHDVFVLDNLSSGKRKNVPEHVALIEGDIRDMEKLELPESIDAIYHLAAQIDVRKSVEDPDFNNAVNIGGTEKVLDYGVKSGAKKIIFSSTGGAIYGPTDQIPTPEEVPCNSSSPYGTSKFEAEQKIQEYSGKSDLQHVILRYSNVYGPGQSGSKETGVIAIFCQRAFDNQSLTINGDGEQTRDFVYVGDVVRANMLALEKDLQGVFNIATGVETSINQLAESLQKVLPHEVEVGHGPGLEGEEQRSCLNIDKAKKELGWNSEVELVDGLRETYKNLIP